MAASSSFLEEDGTTELVFADGRVTRAPSALLYDTLGNPLVTAPGDAQAGAGLLAAGAMNWNGATWDRAYNNVEGTIFASGAHTVAQTSGTLFNPNARGVMLFLDITVSSGTGGLTVNIFPVDPTSGKALGGALLAAGPVSTVATRACCMYPVAFGGAFGFGFQQAPLPRHWQVQVAVGDSSSYTYSLGYCYLV